MTGYGKKMATVGGKAISLEVRSLNSKHLDLSLRLPGLFRQREIEIRNMIGASVIRGKVELSISYENTSDDAGSQLINRSLFEMYYKELVLLTDKYGLRQDDILASILKMPGILQVSDEAPLNEEEWAELQPAIADTLKAFDDFRVKEGSELLKDLIERISLIKHLTDDIEKKENARIGKIRNRLETQLNELKEQGHLDGGRLEAEMIYYIEKLDITEEIVRLNSHCAYLIEVLNEKETEKGKKLAFISQEVGREINTIGSKANDADMQKQVVQMKEQLEKIKEQLNNIL
jgi:uncharacterized protein (TIGR00255 family)